MRRVDRLEGRVDLLQGQHSDGLVDLMPPENGPAAIQVHDLFVDNRHVPHVGRYASFREPYFTPISSSAVTLELTTPASSSRTPADDLFPLCASAKASILKLSAQSYSGTYVLELEPYESSSFPCTGPIRLDWSAPLKM